MTAWLNGKLMDGNEIVVPVESHTVGRGSAIFEVMDVIKTGNGRALFRASAHVDRLLLSAKALRMSLPMSKVEIVTGMKDLARASGYERGAIKVVAYHSNPDFGVIPKDKAVSIAAFVYTIEESLGMSFEECILPVTAGISSVRKLSNLAFNPHIKVAGHYVNAFFANWEAKERGYRQPILLDHNDLVTESSTANLSMVKDGTLITAKSGGILKGITRDSVIQIADTVGIPCREIDYTAKELLAADEAFVTGSIIRIQPLMSINGSTLGDGSAGPVTRRLMDVMEAVYCGADDRFADWVEEI